MIASSLPSGWVHPSPASLIPYRRFPDTAPMITDPDALKVRVRFMGFAPAPVKYLEVTSRNGFESPGSLNKTRQTVKLRGNPFEAGWVLVHVKSELLSLRTLFQSKPRLISPGVSMKSAFKSF